MDGQNLLKVIKIYSEGYFQELGLQQTTIKNKKNALKRLQTFLAGRDFALQTAREYIAYLHKKNWTASSIVTEIKELRAFCSFCVKRKFLTENFCKELVIPKIHKRIRNFVSEEIAEKIIIRGTEKANSDNKLALFVKDEMRIALRFMLRTGIRISEARKIKGADLNLDDEEPHFIVHSKGGDSEVLPIPSDMIKELRPRVNRKKVFEISSAGCNRALQRGSTALKIKTKLTCHSLRHIFSLTRLRKREPLQLVSRALRHSSVSITDNYYSEFLLSDLVPVVNNSDVIRDGIPIEELFNQVEKAIASTGINRDKRVNINIERNQTEIKIVLNKK